MAVTLTVCATCKLAPDQAVDREGVTGGERLARAIEDMSRERRDPPALRRHACLWACANSCAILIGESGKTGYLAGGFVPSADAAAAILGWVDAYAASETGIVRYALWPEGIKGHFIARIPEL